MMVAESGGESKTTCTGKLTIVLKLHTADQTLTPPLFSALTRQ
jgi:hypothetical protein